MRVASLIEKFGLQVVPCVVVGAFGAFAEGSASIDIASRATTEGLIHDLDGDGRPEGLEQFTQNAESWIGVRMSLDCAVVPLQRLSHGELVVWRASGTVNDLDGDYQADFVIGVIRREHSGRGALSVRAYSASDLTLLGQLINSWDDGGVSAPWVVQVAGDVVPDDVVDSEDLAVALTVFSSGGIIASGSVAVEAAADRLGDGSIDLGDVLQLADVIASGSSSQDELLQERLGELVEVSGLFGLILRWFGVLNCAECHVEYADEMQRHAEWLEDANEQLADCNECTSSVNCPIDEVIRCDRLYKRLLHEHALRVRDIASGAAGCILKCFSLPNIPSLP